MTANFFLPSSRVTTYEIIEEASDGTFICVSPYIFHANNNDFAQNLVRALQVAT